MFKFFTILSLMIFFVCTASFSNILTKKNNDYANMSCNELMLKLIDESSFHKEFSDKSMALEFFFERYHDQYILLKFVRRAGVDKDGIYANFQLDLKKLTLNIIDPDPPISIVINKNYLPYIARKCTPDKNIYGNTGKLPD